MAGHSRMILAVVIGLACATSAARADETAYCRAARERLAADASLLMWPQIVSQGIRFPSASSVDPTLIGASGFQFRAGLEFSPLDLAKGLRLQRTADAQCQQHQAQVDIEELLIQGEDVGRLPALREQIAYLEAQRLRWQELQSKAEQQFAAHVITLTERDDIRKRVVELERKVVQAQGEVERLEARPPAPSPSALSRLVNAYEARTARLEEASARVRALAAWQFRLTGGAVVNNERRISPRLVRRRRGELQPRRLWRAESSRAALISTLVPRKRKSARYELSSRLDDFRKQAGSLAAAQARRELEILHREGSALASTLRALEGSDAPNLGHTLSVLYLDEIWTASEESYQRALIEQLSPLELTWRAPE